MIIEEIYGKSFRNELLRNTIWLKIAGLLLFISAIIEIIAFFNFDSFYFLIPSGFLLAAIVMFIQAFKFWTYHWLGLKLHLIAGILDLSIAILYWLDTSYGLYVTLLPLALSFLIIGIYRITIASTQGIIYYGWGWTYLCGIINILLALIIVIFYFINVYLLMLIVSTLEFLFTGIAFFMLGFGANKIFKLSESEE